MHNKKEGCGEEIQEKGGASVLVLLMLTRYMVIPDNRRIY